MLIKNNPRDAHTTSILLNLNPQRLQLLRPTDRRHRRRQNRSLQHALWHGAGDWNALHGLASLQVECSHDRICRILRVLLRGDRVLDVGLFRSGPQGSEEHRYVHGHGDVCRSLCGAGRPADERGVGGRKT